jgi:all-trans-8'-apo-beta-carotenal 15,15'-oxygenase
VRRSLLSSTTSNSACVLKKNRKPAHLILRYCGQKNNMRFFHSLAIIALLGGQTHGFQLSPSVSTMQSRSTSSISASVAEGSVNASLMQQQSPQSPPDMQAYSNGFKTVFNEVSCSLCTPTQGALPSDLIGTYYKCGPAMFSAGSLPPPKNSLVKPKQPPVPDGEDMSRMVLHPFEGDGAVLAMTFHGHDKIETGDDNVDDGTDIVDTKGKVTTRFRYIRTNAFTNERKKGKKLYTGMESTRSNDNSGSVGNDLPLPFYRHHLLNGLNKLRKNTSNTRAVYFGKKLLTLWAGGLPYKLDSLALSTDGRSQLGGIIKREENAMSSSAVIDSKSNRILFYGIDEEANGSTLNIYEFNSKFQPVKENDGTVQVKLPGLALVYDFGVTENFCVFVQPQLKVNGMQYMLNKEPGKSATLESQSSVSYINLLIEILKVLIQMHCS